MKLTDAYNRECDAEDFVLCVGVGWQPIVRQLFADMLAAGWDGRVIQVKEKWGGLRVYVGGAPDAVHDLIESAETKSCITCEDCGADGQMRGGSYVRTLCDKCYGRTA